MRNYDSFLVLKFNSVKSERYFLITIHRKFIFNKEIYVLNNQTSIDSIFVIPSHKIYICFSKIKVK